MEMFMSIYILLLATTVIFAQSSDTIRYLVPEELPAGHVLGNLLTDSSLSSRLTADELSQLTFSVLPSGGTRSSVVVVETRTGVIRTAERLDREELCPGVEDCVFTVDVATGPAQFFSIIPVQVKVADVNDNPPVFLDDVIERSISEAAPVGSVISLSPAYDDDLATNGITEYRMDNVNDMFSLVQSRSIDGSLEIHLELLQSLDREVQDSYDVIIIATDGVAPTQHTSTMTTRVHVTDVNDNSPVFTNSTYRIEISENTPVNTVILNVTAHDNDTEHNARLVYSMTERSQTQHGHIFTIDSNTGAVSLQSELDYETTQEYSLFVTVRDNGINPKSAMTSVHVIVKDINDCVPEISVNTLTASGNFEVYENSLAGTFVAHVSVSDGDSAESGNVICSLVVSDAVCDVPDCEVPFKLENLHRSQYKIVTSVELDREHQDQYQLVMRCHDQGQPQLNSSASLQVHVLDQNDNAPKWRTDRYMVDVQENNIPQKSLIQVAALDDDIGRNARLTYEISGLYSDYFNIDPSTGLITTSTVLDHEETDTIRLTLTATDDAETEPLSSTTEVQINILDMNDEVPLFSEDIYDFTVSENAAAGTLVGIVEAVDFDGAPYNIISFAIQSSLYSDLFAIDSRSGYLRTSVPLDREMQANYHLTLIASNPGFTGLSSTVQAIIRINDTNDNWPIIQYPSINNNTIILSPELATDSFVYHVIAYDNDAQENAVLSYSITAGDYLDLFHINDTTGIITTAKELQIGDGITFELIIQVDDHGSEPKVTVATLSIDIKFVYVSPLGFTNLSSKQLLILGICLVVVFFLFFLVLALALIFCRRRHRSESVVKESESMLKARDVMSTSTTQTTLRHSESKQANEHNTVMKDGEKNTTDHMCQKYTPNQDIELTCYDPYPDDEKNDVTKPTITIATMEEDLGGCPMADDTDTGIHLEAPVNKTMEVHRYLKMLASRDHDNESTCSDSGRGTSEECDEHKQIDPPITEQQLTNWLPSCHHSYKQLPVVHSFLPEGPSKPRNHNHYNSNRNNSNPLTDTYPSDSYYVVTHNHISQTTIHAVPRDTNNATILRSPKLSRQMNDNMIRSSLRQCQNNPSVPSLVNYKDSLNRTKVSISDTWDDDVTTTTSGSYIVDHDDFWQYQEEAV